VAPADPDPPADVRKPEPIPSVEPIVPTDYAVASVRVSNTLLPLLQRRITVGISASNSGRAAAETVTITFAFRRSVHFGGVVSPGWDCGAAVPNLRLQTLTCSATLAAGQGATFAARSRDLIHSGGTITVAAPGDPVPGNNAATFRPGLWPLS